MIYTYACKACDHTEDLNFAIGTAPTEIEASDHILRLTIGAPAVKVVGGTGAGYKRRD